MRDANIAREANRPEPDYPGESIAAWWIVLGIVTVVALVGMVAL